MKIQFCGDPKEKYEVEAKPVHRTQRSSTVNQKNDEIIGK